jgi:hypothetical protein
MVCVERFAALPGMPARQQLRGAHTLLHRRYAALHPPSGGLANIPRRLPRTDPISGCRCQVAGAKRVAPGGGGERVTHTIALSRPQHHQHRRFLSSPSGRRARQTPR